MDPHSEGYEAYKQGVAFRANPYEWSSHANADAWDEGWVCAKSDDEVRRHSSASKE